MARGETVKGTAPALPAKRKGKPNPSAHIRKADNGGVIVDLRKDDNDFDARPTTNTYGSYPQALPAIHKHFGFTPKAQPVAPAPQEDEGE